MKKYFLILLPFLYSSQITLAMKKKKLKQKKQLTSKRYEKKYQKYKKLTDIKEQIEFLATTNNLNKLLKVAKKHQDTDVIKDITLVINESFIYRFEQSGL